MYYYFPYFTDKKAEIHKSEVSAQGHTDIKWQSRDLNQYSLAFYVLQCLLFGLPFTIFTWVKQGLHIDRFILFYIFM